MPITSVRDAKMIQARRQNYRVIVNRENVFYDCVFIKYARHLNTTMFIGISFVYLLPIIAILNHNVLRGIDSSVIRQYIVISLLL